MLRAGAIAVLVVTAAGCGMIVGADFDGLRGPTEDPSTSAASSDGGPDGKKKPNGQDGGSSSSSSSSSSGGDADGGGPGSGHCEGTAPKCNAFIESSKCGAIRGCAWSAPKCLVTSDCASKTTNQACMMTPGCATDVTTSTCKPKAGFCIGTTEPECETTNGCGFTGGCEGTATACTAINDEGVCITQKGCVWQ